MYSYLIQTTIKYGHIKYKKIKILFEVLLIT